MDGGTVRVPIGMYNQQLLQARNTYMGIFRSVISGHAVDMCVRVCMHGYVGTVVAKFHPVSWSFSFLTSAAYE